MWGLRPPLLFGGYMSTSTVQILWEGIKLQCPPSCALAFRRYSYKSFPTNFCGAGKGLGELIVPDYIFGPTRFLKFIGMDISIKIAPACYIHDADWDCAEPTWDAFHEANDRFHRNLEAIIDKKARCDLVRARAMYRPVTYKNAVDTVGRSVFWALKKKQGSIPESAQRYIKG